MCLFVVVASVVVAKKLLQDEARRGEARKREMRGPTAVPFLPALSRRHSPHLLSASIK